MESISIFSNRHNVLALTEWPKNYQANWPLDAFLTDYELQQNWQQKEDWKENWKKADWSALVTFMPTQGQWRYNFKLS